MDYSEIIPQVIAKARAGFDTGVNDLWSHALSYHFFPGTSLENLFSPESTHGAGVLYSDIPTVPAYRFKALPYPITVINARPPLFEELPPGTNLPLNVTVYEATPFEFGSYDPALQAFIEMKHLGTRLNQLQPESSDSCVTNFDQAGFIVGSSSSLFFVSKPLKIHSTNAHYRV